MSGQLPSQPHLGSFINDYMVKNRITRAECARRMGVTPTEMTKYLTRPSLQFHVLWKFCVALNHDFLSDLAAKYPENVARVENPKIKEMQLQIEVYKDLLKR